MEATQSAEMMGMCGLIFLILMACLMIVGIGIYLSNI